MNRLVIIDGNAILHRAYHALPPLTDPRGNIVNAVYGFTSMLLKIFHDLTPNYLAVAFDRPKPTFRKEMYAGYQAHRPKMDDDLIPQVEKVHEVVRSFGIPIYEMDGYEADDVIGTIVNKAISRQSSAISCQSEDQNQAESRKLKADSFNIDQIIIVTGDRDILQLVREGEVFVWMPVKGLSEAKLYGEKETVERMGVRPSQIPDLKALAGDASDNYPGVAGIGPKTAVDLLSKFHSIDQLYADLHQNQELRIKNQAENNQDIISENVRQKLLLDEKSALLSHQLATIKQDVPIKIEINPISTLDTQEARTALSDLGFKSLVKRLSGEETGKNSKQRTKTAEHEMNNKKNKTDETEQQSLF